ncbi:YqaJ viral recombinase family protein, partial [Staphylococcus aureus]|uniref:YqaJ viral recombinase family protein n=1 Tax=Staphylococcus aureus TaxID=1280 RepID=UPI003F7EE3A3
PATSTTTRRTTSEHPHHLRRALEQGSPEWLQARCGVVTASVIGQLITSSKPGADMYACPKCDASAGDPCISVAAKEPKPLKVMHSERFTIAADTDAAPILSIAMTDTAEGAILRLAAERISGHVEETFTTWDMQRGHDDEPKARDEYEQRHDVTVDEIGFM